MTTPLEEYRLIPLTQGQFAKVSLHRYEEIMRYRWFAAWSKDMESFYARSESTHGVLIMHRLIVGLSTGDARAVDHINHDTLDNRDGNLRTCTYSENQWNRGKQCNNSSGYKGVCIHRNSGLWRADIQVNRRRLSLGYYKTKEEAYAAYCEAAKKHHGEFANVS